MVFGGHRAVFGGIDHRVLPRGPVPPAAPEETAWDARTGPIGISRGRKSRTLCAGVSGAISLRLYGDRVERAWGCLCTAPDIPALDLTGISPGANPSSVCDKALAQKRDARVIKVMPGHH